MAKKDNKVDSVAASPAEMAESFVNGIRNYQNDNTQQVPPLRHYNNTVVRMPSNPNNPRGSNNG